MRKTIVQIKNVLSVLPDYIRFHLRGHGCALNIFTHLTVQECLLLYRLARRQKSGSVLCEIGSYLGASACFLAAGATEIIGKKATVHCVDTWENEGMTEGMRKTWMQFQKNTEYYRHIIVPHIGKSVDIAKSFKDQIDLLFIDGDHSYEGCRSDIESWLPHLKPGSLLIMHDYGWADGVQKVVQEFILPRKIKGGKLPNLYWAWIK